jgi:hypothetical protein
MIVHLFFKTLRLTHSLVKDSMLLLLQGNESLKMVINCYRLIDMHSKPGGGGERKRRWEEWWHCRNQ